MKPKILLVPKGIAWAFFAFLFLQGVLLGLLLSFLASETRLLETIRDMEAFLAR